MSSSDDVIEVFQIKPGVRKKIGHLKDLSSSSSTSGIGSSAELGVKTRLLIRKGKNGGGGGGCNSASNSSSGNNNNGSRPKAGNLMSSRDNLKKKKQQKSVSYSSQFGRDDYEDEDDRSDDPDDGGIDNVLMRQQQQHFADQLGIMKGIRRNDCVEWRRQQPQQQPEVDNNIKKIRAKVTTLDEILKSQSSSCDPGSSLTALDKVSRDARGVYPITMITPATPSPSDASGRGVVVAAAATADVGRSHSASSILMSSINKTPPKQKHSCMHPPMGKGSSAGSTRILAKSGSNNILPEPYPSCSKSTTATATAAGIDAAASSGNYHNNPLHFQQRHPLRYHHGPFVTEPETTSSSTSKWNVAGKSDTSGIISGEENLSDGGDYSGSETPGVGEERDLPSSNCCDCTCWCCGCQGSSSCSRRRHQRHHQSHSRLHRRASHSSSRIFRWRDCWSQLIKSMPSCLHSLLGFIAKIYWRLVDGIFGIEPPYRDHNGEGTKRLTVTTALSIRED